MSLVDAKVKLIEKKIFHRFWIKDSTCKSLHEFSDTRTMNIVFKDVHIFCLKKNKDFEYCLLNTIT